MKICFIICWFGEFPHYMPIWLKSCAYNKEYDFLIITDKEYHHMIPENVKFKFMSLQGVLARIKEIISKDAKLSKAYRICDYRPMFGLIFAEEIQKYDFWGYCDIDVVFGKISDFISYKKLNRLEAIFNRGHFTLIKNDKKMNHLFELEGSLFDYKTVAKKEAIFAFDENTGIQRIAKKNNIIAEYSVPFIEADSKFTQLASRFEKNNPKHQAFYWEDGKLIRVKHERGKKAYQETMYIHLQKRKIEILDADVLSSDSFWIMPDGFKSKRPKGLPSIEEMDFANPSESNYQMKKEKLLYNIKKTKSILGRKPYQIYVRIKQQLAGINADDGILDGGKWEKY